MKEIIGFIFGMGLFINASLFAIQAVKIIRLRSADGVSIFTFAGFSFIQITGVLHGYLQGDLYLMFGMAASFLTCGTVIALAIIYRSGTSNVKEIERL